MMPDQIIGGSPAIKRLRASLQRLASDAGPIVITGETGTGKSLFAAHIHARSDRSSADLEVVNFSLLSERDQRVAILGGGPPELTTTRRSLLENRTTVILKNIDNASPFLQQTLTHSLLGGKILRPGSQESHVVHARPIFTFHSPLRSLLRKKALDPALIDLLRSSRKFGIPPLRKRPQHIPLLALDFLRGLPHARGLTTRGSLDPRLEKLLLAQSWEGNITQLTAYLSCLALPTYANVFAEAERIELAKMLLLIQQRSDFSLRNSLAKIEESLIRRALDRCDGNQHRSASLLGLTDRSVGR